MNRFKDQKGQSLIEAIAALAIATVVASAITVAVVIALRNIQFSRSQNLSNQYAQEGVEILRNMRDTNLVLFNGLSGSYCLEKTDTFLDVDDRRNSGILLGCSRAGGGPNPNIDTTFVRQIDIERPSGACNNQTKATVSVSWTDGKCTTGAYCHNVKLTSCFTDYNSVSAP